MYFSTSWSMIERKLVKQLYSFDYKVGLSDVPCLIFFIYSIFDNHTFQTRLLICNIKFKFASIVIFVFRCKESSCLTEHKIYFI